MDAIGNFLAFGMIIGLFVFIGGAAIHGGVQRRDLKTILMGTLLIIVLGGSYLAVYLTTV